MIEEAVLQERKASMTDLSKCGTFQPAECEDEEVASSVMGPAFSCRSNIHVDLILNDEAIMYP